MLQFTVSEKEIICSLDLKANEEALELQKNIALELSYLFKYGAEDVARDKWKAAKYKEQAQKLAAPAGSILRTKTAYSAFSDFNFLRLYILRFDFVFGFFVRSFLPRLFSIGGLSYGLALLFDVGVVLYSTFRKSTPEENQLMQAPPGSMEFYWRRFVNVLFKDNRPSRMANAAIWFAINFTTFLITGGYSVFLNIAGFGFDIAHEFYKGYRVYNAQKKLFNKISAELDEQVNLLEKAKLETPEAGEELHNYLIKVQSMQKEVDKLRCMQTQLNKKITSSFYHHAYDFISTAIVLTGFAMMFIPALQIPGVIITTIGLLMDTPPLLKKAAQCFNAVKNAAISLVGFFAGSFGHRNNQTQAKIQISLVHALPRSGGPKSSEYVQNQNQNLRNNPVGNSTIAINQTVPFLYGQPKTNLEINLTETPAGVTQSTEPPNPIEKNIPEKISFLFMRPKNNSLFKCSSAGGKIEVNNESHLVACAAN